VPCAAESDFLVKKKQCRIICDSTEHVTRFFFDYLREFEAIFEKALTYVSGTQEKLFDVFLVCTSLIHPIPTNVRITSIFGEPWQLFILLLQVPVGLPCQILLSKYVLRSRYRKEPLN
jgi:hypothetical protein